MKTGTNFDKRCEPAVDGDLSGCRCGDVGKQLEDRAFTGTVVSDDSNRLASLNCETNISNGPKVFRPSPKTHPLADERVACRVGLNFVANAITLAYVIKNEIGHRAMILVAKSR